MKKLMSSMAVLAALVAGITAHAQVNVYWSGAAADNNWDNVTNWTASPLNNFAHVDTLTAYPIITVSNTIVPNDVKIGAPQSASSPTGRVDVLSETLSYVFWSFVGDWQGNGTLNIADTSGSGGTYTGYGLGSGSFVSQNAAGNNNTMVGLYQSTGVLNMNTTGSLEAQNLHISPNGQGGSGTFNLDAGTVNVSGNMWVGSDFWGAGTVSDGHFNMSGGEVNVGGNFEVGHLGLSATNGTSDATIAGGTLNVETDLKVGFAGTNTTALMTVKDGATVNVASTNGTRWVVIGQWDPTGPSTLVLSNGATLNLNDGTDIMFGIENNSGPRTLTVDGSTINGDTNGGSYMNLHQNGASSGTSTLNIRNGAVVAVDAIVGFTNDTVNFDNGTLKATANDPYFLGDSMTINLGSGGVTLDTVGHINTVRGKLNGSGGGGMTKRGNGSLTLIGGFNYTGPTRLEQGSLTMDLVSSPVSGSLVVSNGTTLTLNTIDGTGSLDVGVGGNINLYGNTTLNVQYGAGSSPAPLVTAISGSVTNTGTCTINVTGTSIQVGTYTLFLTGASVPTNGFTLNVPPSITAHLNDSGSSLDLVVDTAGLNLVWYGADSSGTVLQNTWDTSTANWDSGTATYTEYGTYSDNVRFDENYAFGLAGVTNVNLPGRVVPQSVVFDDNTFAIAYTLTGTGGIDGSTGLLLSNTVSLFLGTSNSYTGGTIVGAGTTLTITNDNALGTNSGVVTLNGGTLDVAANITGVHPITTAAASSINVASGSTAQLNGAITGTSPLAKVGPGTMAWSANQSLGSSLRVIEGSMNITGGSTELGASSPSAVGYRTNSGAMTLSGGATLTALGDFWVGGTDQTAAGDDANGTMTVSGGTAYFGGVGNQEGHYNGGSLQIGASRDNQSSPTGTMTVSSGTVWSTNDVNVGFAGADGTLGTLNISGTGTVNVGPAATKWLVLGKWDFSSGVMNISGGNLNLMNNSSIAFSSGDGGGGGWGTNVVNQTGGTVTFYSDAGVTVGGTSAGVNLARAGQVPARNTYNLEGGFLITPAISGTDADPVKTFNFNGGTLRAARNNTSFINLGGGTNVVNVRNNGALIDTAGFNVTSVNALQHSTVGGDAATDGGLTKSGLGTLTLASTNNYTGPTVVNAGQLLVVNGSATPGAVTVADGASFGVSSSSASGTATVGNVALGSTTGGDLSFSYSFNGNPTAAALTAGTVTVASGSTVTLAGAFEVGTFPILDYTGALSPLPTLNPPRGTAATLSNDASGTVLYVVVSSVGAPITWDGLYGPLTNVWDINITSNWLFSATQTTYLQPVAPGDAVLFDDSGSGTVLLSNAVSPAKVTVSNPTKAYTISGGGGSISSAAGLTKTGAASVALNVPGTYDSGTVLSNGLVSLGANQTFANLSGDSALTNTSALEMSVDNDTDTVYSGAIAGDLTLRMVGNGSLTLSNTYTAGGIRLDAGRVVLAAPATMTAGGQDVFIGETTGNTGRVDLVSGGSLTMPNSWVFVGHNGGTGEFNLSGTGSMDVNNLWVGGAQFGADGIGIANIDTTGAIQIDHLGLGYGALSHGTLNLSNGVMGVLFSIDVGQDFGGTGVVNQASGTVTNGGYLVIGGQAGSVGTYNLSGGAVIAAGNFGFTTIGSSGGSSGLLNVSGGSLTSVGGMIVGEAWNGGTNTTTATLTVSGTGSVDVSAGNTVYMANNSNTIATVNLDGGTLRAGGVDKGIGTATFNFSGGTLEAANSSTNFMEGLTAANVNAGGAFIDTAGYDIAIGQALIGTGALTKNGAGQLCLNGVNTYSGGTLVNAGTLGGTGTISGIVTVGPAGTLTAGCSIGLLSLANPPVLGGSVLVEVDRAGSPSRGDVINVTSGTLTYANTLVISNAGAPLVVGDSFTNFTAVGGYAGSFGTLVSQTPGQVVLWDTSQLTVNGSITATNVAAAPTIPTTPTNIVFSVSGTTLTLQWPADYTGWSLQAQTNALSVGLKTATNDWTTIGYEGTNKAVITIQKGNPTVFYRLRYIP